MTLSYNSVEQLRARIYELSPHLLKYDFIEPTIFGKIAAKTEEAGTIEKTPFADLLDNYYMTDSS